jgi:Na+/H+ antiporter NhaC
MKLKVTIPIASIMLAVAIYAVSHFSVMEKTANQEAAYEEDAEEALEKAMIEGQRAWMFEMMKNPATGRLEF